MITHAASRKQYTVLLDRPEKSVLFISVSYNITVHIISGSPLSRQNRSAFVIFAHYITTSISYLPIPSRRRRGIFHTAAVRRPRSRAACASIFHYR